MTIRYLGHASFLVAAADGANIVFDPYQPGAFNGAIGYGRMSEPAAVVAISHDHADHNFAAGVPGSPQVIRTPGAHWAGSVRLRGIAAKHDASNGEARGDNVVFCAEIDGVRLCHLGDLGHELSDAQVTEIGPVEVLLCPVGGTFTIDCEGATRVMQALRPRITIPMHFKTPKANLPIAPVDDFLRGKHNVRREGGSEITVTPETLPPEPLLIVLEPAL
ncbi:MAG TPA: MBL fold metallo-hydrolase [Armatimonadota bacterium]|nr:MBL fold metallo-hydrolase [Armatimonadota bacterium]